MDFERLLILDERSGFSMAFMIFSLILLDQKGSWVKVFRDIFLLPPGMLFNVFQNLKLFFICSGAQCALSHLVCNLKFSSTTERSTDFGKTEPQTPLCLHRWSQKS